MSGILEKIIHVQDVKQIVKYVRIKNIARYVQEVFIISLVLVSKNVEMEKDLSQSVMMEIKIMVMVVLQIVEVQKLVGKQFNGGCQFRCQPTNTIYSLRV